MFPSSNFFYTDISVLKTFVQYFNCALEKNQLFQACFFSGLSYSLWNVLVWIYRAHVLPVFAEYYSSITLHNTDPNFDNVISYLSEKISSEGANYSIQARTKPKKKCRKEWIQQWLGTAKENPSFEYRLNSDEVIFKINYKNKVITLKRFKSAQPLVGGFMDQPFTPESLCLTVWGSDNSVLKELLNDALEEKLNKPADKELSIFVQSSAWVLGWEVAMKKPPRSKQSVIFDADHMETLLKDAKWFLRNAQWYLDRGIPYRRGYLLHGPPGCGKTSFVQVLGSELNLDICILNLTNQRLDDNNLAELVRDAPSNCIILVEDVDAIFVEREAAEIKRGGKDKSSPSISFSGLLNAIDGIAAQEGRIFFMTTNHREKLDAALIRPGRCDIQLEIKKASKAQLKMMFLRFFPGEEILACEFEQKLPAFEISMAALQGFFMRFHLPRECVENAAVLLESRTEILNSALCRKSIYDHLERVGIGRYAPFFERKGIFFADQLEKIELKELTSLSVELQYDHLAKSQLKKLLDKDPVFMDGQYSLAEISIIRESFLLAFPCHGSVCGNTELSSSERRNSCLFSPDTLPSAAKQPVREHPITVTHEKLDELSRKFCDKLSKNGKPVISLYNLRLLLDAHPGEPQDCFENAEAFVLDRENLPGTHSLKEMSAKEFLKRAGLFSKMHSFSEFKTATQLIEKFTSIAELSKELTKNYDLSNEEAAVL